MPDLPRVSWCQMPFHPVPLQGAGGCAVAMDVLLITALTLAGSLVASAPTPAALDRENGAPAAESVPVILRLLKPDGSRIANTQIVLSCPNGRLRMLTSDAAGLVRSAPPDALVGCTVHADVSEGPYSARIEGRVVEPITLHPGTQDTEFVPFAEATPGGGPAQKQKQGRGREVSRDSAGLMLSAASLSVREFVESAPDGRASITWSEIREGRRVRRKRRRARRAARRGESTGRVAVADPKRSPRLPESASSGPPESEPTKSRAPRPAPVEPPPRSSPPLTAGAVDDVNTPRGFHRYLETVPINAPLRERFTGPHRVVQVVDALGRPVAGATVELAGRSYRSRRDGRVVLIPGWDPVEGEQTRAPIVGGRSLLASLDADVTQVVLEQTIEPPAARVDLALVIDTTGSMGDELVYLKAELAALLTDLKSQHSRLDIRWALVVYRDDGDDYVTRHVDFTSDFEAFTAQLAEQVADGGGDMPEAVDAAFVETSALAWRDAAVAGRVVVHVADAPPHVEKVGATLRAADKLRREGTAVYPVAASGVDALAEFTMRTSALMSGGQYVFLTDDSGVGGPHREATAACFRVQPLITVLGKILSAELAGRRADLSGGTEGDGCQVANGPDATRR